VDRIPGTLRKLPHLKAQRVGPWFRFCLVPDLLVRAAVMDFWNMAGVGPLSPLTSLTDVGPAPAEDWIDAPALEAPELRKERLS